MVEKTGEKATKPIEQNNKGPITPKDELDTLLCEHRVLRDEIIEKFTLQYQIIAFQITYVTVLFAYILTTESYELFLVAPFLALALAAIWLSDYIMMMRLGDYLQTIEEKVNTEYFKGKRILNWETNLREKRGFFDIYYVLVMFGLIGVNFFIPIVCVALSLIYAELTSIPISILVVVNGFYVILILLLIGYLCKIVPHKKRTVLHSAPTRR